MKFPHKIYLIYILRVKVNIYVFKFERYLNKYFCIKFPCKNKVHLNITYIYL